MELNLNDILKAPGQNLPDLINLCTATPLAQLCEALDDATKALDLQEPAAVRQGRCSAPTARSACPKKTPLPELTGGLTGSTQERLGGSGGSGGGGGLGGLLGLGGGGG